MAGVLSTHDPRLHRPSLPGSVTDACTSKMYSSKSRSAALLTAERPPEVGRHWARRGRDSPGLAVAVRAGSAAPRGRPSPRRAGASASACRSFALNDAFSARRNGAPCEHLEPGTDVTGEEYRSLRPADGLIDSTSEFPGLPAELPDPRLARDLGTGGRQGAVETGRARGRHPKRLRGGVFS